VGYTLASNNLAKAKLQSLRLYFSVQNMATITGYSGFTPEISSTSTLAGGLETSIYPTTRTFAFGLNLGF
jgi:hypothetical protein